MELSHFTFLVFALLSSLRVVSYVPQIIRVAFDRNGASAISYSTWGLWTAANISTAAYAAINLNDPYLSAVSGVYAVCCVVVIALTMAKRRKLSKRPSKSAPEKSSPAHLEAIALANGLASASPHSVPYSKGETRWMS